MSSVFWHFLKQKLLLSYAVCILGNSQVANLDLSVLIPPSETNSVVLIRHGYYRFYFL